jgi:uncharacterized Tic20 family protein
MNQANPPFDPMGAAPRPGPGAAVGLQEWERTYSTFEHLSLLAAFAGFPIIPCLIMWLIKREQSVFVDDHGKEALNFQISLAIYTAAGFLIFWCFPLSILLWTAVAILGLVGMIQGAVAANHGRYYRYPATIRLLH